MNSNPLRVLIVGCGNIAGSFDQYRLPSDLPLTHAGAFSRDARFSIVACVEPDANRRNRFMGLWGVPAGFHSIDELVGSNERFDVISICSPTATHTHDIKISLRLMPQLIFCEKPVTISVSETERYVVECRKANILMAVNYTRRWDPEVSKVRSEIQAGKWGEMRSVSGVYNKGVLNNGSHMIDLLHLLVGSVDIVHVGTPIEDFFSTDPTVPLWLESKQGVPIYLSCGHAGDYALFELQLVFSHGVLTMEEGGMYWRERLAIDSTTFNGYRKLDDGVRRAGGYPYAMLQAVDNIYNAIKQGEPLASTVESALDAQRLCEQVKGLAFKQFQK